MPYLADKLMLIQREVKRSFVRNVLPSAKKTGIDSL